MLFVWMMVATGALAQNTTATLSGSVKDEYGSPIEAASIQVSNNDNGTYYGAVTNRFGIFSLSGLRPGNYSVSISFIGFIGQKFEDVVLSIGEDYNINVVLKEDTQNIPEVTISGGSIYFNETRTGQTYNVNSQSMSMLPSVKRSVTFPSTRSILCAPRASLLSSEIRL